jgi:hypothetical protein
MSAVEGRAGGDCGGSLLGALLMMLWLKGGRGSTTWIFQPIARVEFMNSTSNGVATLLYVDLAGNAHPLWQPKYPTVSLALQSRDGRRLAIMGESDSSNLRMLKDF